MQSIRAARTVALFVLSTFVLAAHPVHAQPLWPPRHFAPYVDATAWPPFDLLGAAQNQGLRFYTLAFIVAQGANDCTPSWGGYYPCDQGYLLAEIHALRALDGDVMLSFGGAGGTELAVACEDVPTLQAAYQSVIDAYDLTHIDFDIEGAWTAHGPSIERRSQAIAGLQADAAGAGRELKVWFTLPVLPGGLTADGVNVLASALQHGVELTGVNIMAMDYGDDAAPNPDHQMGEYAIQAAISLFGQLRALHDGAGIPRSDAELWHMVGVTPMIGRNDVLTEVFYQEDAEQVLAFALEQDLGMLAFWSANRDQQCSGGEQPGVSPTCSSILQEPFEFSRIFLPFTGGTGSMPDGRLPSVEPDGLGLVSSSPVGSRGVLRFELLRETRVRLTIHDLAGRRVADLLDEVASPGRRRVDWDASRLPAGFYFCRLIAGGESRTERFVVIR